MTPPFPDQNNCSNACNCQRYGPDDYQRVMDGDMSHHELSEYELHFENCTFCQSAISVFFRQKEQKENQSLFKRTLSLMDTLDQESRISLVEVVINVGRGILDLISTTATLLTPSMQPATRGIPRKGKKASGVQILQEINDPPMSIQVRFTPDPVVSRVLMEFSFMNVRDGTFIPDVTVALSDTNPIDSQTSNKKGIANFNVKAPGCYHIQVVHDSRTVSQFQVTLTDE
jgi:hypothetical protein